ncbi:MAG: HAD superfamily hydrolase (TIGR01509 family) [Verrucomicrobiales bacterium]|jgi:HAD superfamily hydrolase (TIGR01509 family)
MKTSFSAVVFDMDGTLFDSEPLYCRAYCHAIAMQGFEFAGEEYFRCLAGTTNYNIEFYLAEKFGENFDPISFRENWPPALKRIIEKEGLPVMPGICGLLNDLREREIPLAVASSSDMDEIERFLGIAELRSFFSVLVGGDEVERSKPDPEIYHLAAQRLDVSSQLCIAIEDSNPGVLAASRAGMKVIMTPGLAGAGDESMRRATVTDDVRAEVIGFFP